MVETLMFMGIGFLAGCLLTLGFIPLVHARAVRLTARQYQDATPASVAEMEAEKDGLRAEFAMSTRRLEIALEAARAKAAGHLCDIGKKTQEIQLLKSKFNKAAADHLCEMARKSEETHSLFTTLGKSTQEIEFTKTEFSKATAEHPYAIPKKSEETQNRPIELDRVITQYTHEVAIKPEEDRANNKGGFSLIGFRARRDAILKLQRLISLDQAAVKWVASAAASIIIVSLLLLAASSDQGDQRRTAFILRGSLPVTDPAPSEPQATEVTVISRGVGQTNSAMSEGEPAPRSGANVVIIRGGRRESKP